MAGKKWVLETLAHAKRLRRVDGFFTYHAEPADFGSNGRADTLKITILTGTCQNIAPRLFQDGIRLECRDSIRDPRTMSTQKAPSNKVSNLVQK